MLDYEVAALASHDFEAVMRLEERLFGSKGEKTLGPFYVRLCCDFYGDTCFLARAYGEPVGYVLAFVRDREAYCSTLAIVPEFQRTRVVHYLIQSFIKTIAYRVDTVVFTVSPDNADARALHATLGAKEIETRLDYFGPGEPRIVSRIDRPAFEKLRARMERLGLLEQGSGPRAVVA